MTQWVVRSKQVHLAFVHSVVYQTSGFTPAWSVSEWWLARTGCRDRRSA